MNKGSVLFNVDTHNLMLSTRCLFPTFIYYLWYTYLLCIPLKQSFCFIPSLSLICAIHDVIFSIQLCRRIIMSMMLFFQFQNCAFVSLLHLEYRDFWRGLQNSVLFVIWLLKVMLMLVWSQSNSEILDSYLRIDTTMWQSSLGLSHSQRKEQVVVVVIGPK